SSLMETPRNPQMATMMGAAASAHGQSTVTKMSRYGEIYETVMRNDMGEVTGSMGGGGGGGGMGGGAGGRPDMKGGKGGGGNRNMFALPNRPVRVGESWTDTLTSHEGDNTSTMMATYTLTRVENSGGARVAVINYTGSLTGQAQGGTQNMQITGELRFD